MPYPDRDDPIAVDQYNHSVERHNAALERNRQAEERKHWADQNKQLQDYWDHAAELDAKASHEAFERNQEFSDWLRAQRAGEFSTEKQALAAADKAIKDQAAVTWHRNENSGTPILWAAAEGFKIWPVPRLSRETADRLAREGGDNFAGYYARGFYRLKDHDFVGAGVDFLNGRLSTKTFANELIRAAGAVNETPPALDLELMRPVARACQIGEILCAEHGSIDAAKDLPLDYLADLGARDLAEAAEFKTAMRLWAFGPIQTFGRPLPKEMEVLEQPAGKDDFETRIRNTERALAVWEKFMVAGEDNGYYRHPSPHDAPVFDKIHAGLLIQQADLWRFGALMRLKQARLADAVDCLEKANLSVARLRAWFDGGEDPYHTAAWPITDQTDEIKGRCLQLRSSSDARAICDAGEALLALGEIGQAKALWQHAQEIEPASDGAAVGLGWVQGVSGDWAGAERSVGSSTSFEGLYLKGVAQKRSGNPSGACLKTFAAAAALPGRPQLRGLKAAEEPSLAAAYFSLGRYDDSFEAYRDWVSHLKSRDTPALNAEFYVMAAAARRSSRPEVTVKVMKSYFDTGWPYDNGSSRSSARHLMLAEEDAERLADIRNEIKKLQSEKASAYDLERSKKLSDYAKKALRTERDHLKDALDAKEDRDWINEVDLRARIKDLESQI